MTWTTVRAALYCGSVAALMLPAELVAQAVNEPTEDVIAPPVEEPANSLDFGSAINAFIAPPAEKMAVTPGGVDIRTGRYAYSQTDLQIGGEGGLSLAREMGHPFTGQFGNFASSLSVWLIVKRVDIDKGNYAHGSGEDYRVSVFSDGKSETFEAQSYELGFQQVSQHSTATLTHTGVRGSASGFYTFEASDGTIARFTPGDGQIAELIRPNGTRLLYEYEPPPSGTAAFPRLRSITTNRGYGLLFEYGGTGGGWGFVAKACAINLAEAPKSPLNLCPSGAPSSTYGYTDYRGRTRLATVTDASGATSRFNYADHYGQLRMHFLKPGEGSAWMSLTIGEGSTPQGDYVERTDQQSFATGEWYNYDYDTGFEHTGGTVDTIAGGVITNASGHRTEVRYAFPRRPKSMNPQHYGYNGEPQENVGDAYFQVTPGPVSIIDPLGRTTTYDYCNPYMAQALPSTDLDRCVVSQLQSFIDPEGVRTELTYGGSLVTGVRRKAKPGSGLPDVVLSASYQCHNKKTCVSPNRVTDAQGNVSTATYSVDHGGVLTQTGPAVNGVQPQKRFEYAQRYAWLSNGAGGYVAASTPVWLLVSESYCRTSAWNGSACSATNDEVITFYDYGPNSGPNNLLLRGTLVTSAGQSRRTCYRYDSLGRKISETTANANLTSCP